MDVRLIAEVARWPILYNTAIEEHKNVELRNLAWSDISSALFGTTSPHVVEMVKNKWKNLRDTFVKSLRKKDRPNSKPWKLEGEMKFLIPYINLRYSTAANGDVMDNQNPPSPQAKGNEPSWEVDIIKKEKINDDILENESPLQNVETVLEDSPRREPLPKRKRKRESFNVQTAGLHFLDGGQSIYDQMQNPGSYDNIDYFFLGLAASVKRLKPVNQIVLKRAIANLVFDTEMKELDVSTYEATSSS